jgi:undecaprenyl-diphosphatase
VRSPADVLRLVVSSFALLVFVVVDRVSGEPVVRFAHDLLRGVDALGEGFVTAVVSSVRIAAAGLVATALVVAVASGRWRMLGTALLAIGVGIALFAVVDQRTDVGRPALVHLSQVLGPVTSSRFPGGAGIAAVAATATAAGPWLSRRHRRLPWILVLGLTATRFLVAPMSSSALAALLTGWTAGAAAVVMLRAPSQRPTPQAVIDGLRSVGLELTRLDAASVDARGSTPYFGTTADGRELFVKVLGRDERSADLLFRLYRRIVPRNRGDERAFSSLRRAVEHEALVSLVATRLGIRTPTAAGFAGAEPHGFILCYEAVEGRSLDRVEADDIDDEVLTEIWRQLAVLRRHRIAHRDLRLANLFLDRDRQVWFVDFGFAELAASDLLLATDLAEVLASLGVKVGPARAVESGATAIGLPALQTALPRLRPYFLSGATRSAIKQDPRVLTEIIGLLEHPPATFELSRIDQTDSPARPNA